ERPMKSVRARRWADRTGRTSGGSATEGRGRARLRSGDALVAVMEPPTSGTARAGRVEVARLLVEQGSPPAMVVLDLAAKEAGWGRPLPGGRGRGVALLRSAGGATWRRSPEAKVTASGEVRLHRIVCAVDCGRSAAALAAA